MGQNSSRSLTYLLVLGVVGGLIYAIYNTNKSRRAKSSPAYDSTSATNGSSNVSSTDTSLLVTSPAAMHIDSTQHSITGHLAKGVTNAVASANEVTNYGTEKVRKAMTSSPEIINTEDPSLSDKSVTGSSDPIASSTKTKVTSKGVHAAKSHHAKQKFNPGAEKGDFMVVAGNFASKDNADALVTKLKKIGFAKAEIVKLDNSATLHVIAGNYSYKGGAEAAVRTLKTHKVQCYVKKKSGDVYKASNPTPAATATSQPS